MLYATTRSDRDIYTAQRALTEQRAPDGGFYVPFREPGFSRDQLQGLYRHTAQETMAQVLNLLFRTRLTAWDLEFAAGRRPLRLQAAGRRTLAGERWHNTGGEFQCLVSDLTDRTRADGEKTADPAPWARIGAGIASLCALMGEAGREFTGEGTAVDVAVNCETLYDVVSAWFLRSWGLPIGRVVCGSGESSPLWELCHSGQLRTEDPETRLPEGLELLLYLCGGRWEVRKFLEACCSGGIYKPGENTLRRLRRGMFVSVVSERRVLQTIPSVCSAHDYLMGPGTVLPYAGMLDYRAGTGESGWGMILADRDPGLDCELLAQALGTDQEAVRKQLNKR